LLSEIIEGLEIRMSQDAAISAKPEEIGDFG